MVKNIAIILFLVFYLLSCNFETKSQSTLVLLESIKLDISEPSGISIFENHLFIVNDSKGNIYKTSLKGKIISIIKTDFNDLEGVAVDENGNLFVVNEHKRTFVKMKTNGGTDKKYKVKGSQKKNNSGLEGICYSKKLDCFFVVNESSPREVLKISKKGKVKESFKIDFANDLSGISFHEESNSLWIVSDESKAVYNLNLQGELLKKYKIFIEKAEGITIHKNKIYIVSDSENKLYVFKKVD